MYICTQGERERESACESLILARHNSFICKAYRDCYEAMDPGKYFTSVSRKICASVHLLTEFFFKGTMAPSLPCCDE